jgi:hypothetical protein
MSLPRHVVSGACPAGSSRGFTLIEVVISIALLVTVIGILLLGSTAITDGWQKLEVQSQRFEAVLILDRTVDGIFANIVPFTWPDPDNVEVPVFVGRPAAMTAAYMHAFNRLEDGAIRFCTFLLEEDEFVVYYCDRPPFPEDLMAEGLGRSVLATGVESVSFSYADLEDEALVFVDDWQDRTYHPLAVWLHIVWQNGTYEDWLRRTAGSSYHERWGIWTQKEEQR